MYDRLNRSRIPDPFRQFPAAEEPLTTLDFCDCMTLLLTNCQGLAGTVWAASRSADAAQQDLSQTLFVLNEYLECTVTLFTRWKDEQHAGASSQEDPDA